VALGWLAGDVGGSLMTSAADTDADLIERSVRGQPEAFVAVVERHEVAVHGYLARRAGRQAADDLLAEVWARAFAGRAGYRACQVDAGPWLYGIARNVLASYWQATLRSRMPAQANAVARTPDDPWDDVIDRIDSAASSRPLMSALQALPPADREVILLVAWEQLTPAEAATVLGIPQGTARSRLHRARAALRLALAGTRAEFSGRADDRASS
jgi:RNA polymerase sigma factor (sigma-70 family)